MERKTIFASGNLECARDTGTHILELCGACLLAVQGATGSQRTVLLLYSYHTDTYYGQSLVMAPSIVYRSRINLRPSPHCTAHPGTTVSATRNPLLIDGRCVDPVGNTTHNEHQHNGVHHMMAHTPDRHQRCLFLSPSAAQATCTFWILLTVPPVRHQTGLQSTSRMERIHTAHLKQSMAEALTPPTIKTV
ncbi:hypothetical protein B0I72DRAFT_35896 [Yarrowia lipolytica]|jgi:hypothetical protein|uniref:YALI0C21736p n=2 Tax=Yarrowia lipolytica TaxID=4952 RepID=Q6CB58_YARLI|nr:YALI0C21736p [Yarrowia lipolytica CLIB122]AOW03218.1 hypothetical protein YALI1_C30007g [Yarrowia lipolytica]KAB8281138.1 hypothetical protein BKA91DRAFT_36565 [Yarrowia lipolytica]KAE8172977.1 hypothetical protein BKA90DRAFT_12457 [Yarrowia lipolytica]KAJ8053714.1 hypothetical protein LXG23DRAFT_22815 [Yarrowia lipolytica]RDW27124.1 hypothetical protein B0I71DRAFT_25141 [Yarrowia lipolytica]|eukprot:XP_502104.1 YALI0C21736p [Yarrowia lipolytica CLIB122]